MKVEFTSRSRRRCVQSMRSLQLAVQWRQIAKVEVLELRQLLSSTLSAVRSTATNATASPAASVGLHAAPFVPMRGSPSASNRASNRASNSTGAVTSHAAPITRTFSSRDENEEEEEEEEGDRDPTTFFGTPQDGSGGAFDPTELPVVAGSWTFVGPGPQTNGQVPGGGIVSGRMTSIAASPTDANTIYAGTAGGGVWKTTDGGTTWSTTTDAQANTAIGSIAIAPSNTAVIYAGMGEVNNSGDCHYGRGVLKSTNSGASWTLMGNSVFNRYAIGQIVVDPTNANTVYACVGGFPNQGFSGNRGIWKSTDGGVNWTNTTTAQIAGSSSQNFSDLVIDPTAPNTLYAAIGTYFGNTLNGIYKTTNGGTTWTAVNTGLTSGSSAGRIALAIAKNAPATLYAAVVHPSTYALLNIFKTTNSATSWAATTSSGNITGAQGWYDISIAVSPTDANNVYAAGAASTGHVTHSSNGGTSWTSVTTGANGAGPHVDHHASTFDASGRYLDGNDGGIWRFDGTNWSDLNGNLGTIQFQGIAIDPTNANVAFGGSQDNGTSKYTGTNSWATVEGGDGGDVAVSPNNSSRIYHIAPVGSFGSASYFRRSDNSGNSWLSKTTGLTNSGGAAFYPPFVVDPGNFAGSDRLLLGTTVINESTNNGDSWSSLGANGANSIIAIAIAPTTTNTIYYTDGSTTFVTTNHGANWTSVSTLGSGVSDLAVDPTNSQIVYAVRNVFGGNKVFRSVNGGTAWTSINGTLPDIPVNALALDPKAAGATDDVVYVGTDAGVYALINPTGASPSWNLMGTGLANAQVLDLEFAPATNILAAGTHGRGMWEIFGLTTVTNGTWTGLADGTNWTNAGNWSNNTLPGPADNVVISVAGLQTIVLASGTQSVNNVTCDENLTISGGTLTIATVSTVNGSLTLSGGTVNGAGNLTLTNATNTWTSGTMAGAGKTTVASGAALNESGAGVQSLTRLLEVAGNVNVPTAGTRTLKLATLSVIGTGKLDLFNNDMIITGTARATIQGYIKNAYHFGDWLGTTGIFSTTARTNATGNTSLGLLSGTEFINNNGGLFNGQSVIATDVLVKYTYFGDIDFNGSIDAGDYNIIDFGFVNHLTGWGFGDVDYSGGGADASDYNVIDFAFSTQSGIL